MSLNRQQWPRAEALFCKALELPAARRAAYLLRACPDDAALREEVATLLAAAESGNSLLSQPAAIAVRSGVDAGAAREHLRRAIKLFQAREGAGSRYRVLARILWARSRSSRPDDNPPGKEIRKP